jgi:hypothetical protein
MRIIENKSHTKSKQTKIRRKIGTQKWLIQQTVKPVKWIREEEMNIDYSKQPEVKQQNAKN